MDGLILACLFGLKEEAGGIGVRKDDAPPLIHSFGLFVFIVECFCRMRLFRSSLRVTEERVV